MLASYDYHCPHCKNKLTHGDSVQFIVENTKQQRATMTLSPLPGVYSHSSDIDLLVRRGEKLKFHCPSCETDLQSNEHPKFVEIYLQITDTIVFEVLFSPICGEKLTYVIMQGELEKYEDSFLAFDMKKVG